MFSLHVSINLGLHITAEVLAVVRQPFDLSALEGDVLPLISVFHAYNVYDEYLNLSADGHPQFSEVAHAPIFYP